MGGTQWYIGAPNGVVLCVDSVEGYRIGGRFYHAYKKEATEFRNMDELFFRLEQFYNFLNFPHPSTNERTFQDKKQREDSVVRRTRVMNDEELLSRHGDIGSFIIRVQHRQNSSWQGRITWMEKDKTVYFRSIWEMIKLIGSALDTVSEQDGVSGEISWMEDGEEDAENTSLTE